ncbi:MAG: cell division protein ZapB [Myxococcota bacterium]|nr:cell division protein ZapB [Myxococcota bacterium]
MSPVAAAPGATGSRDGAVDLDRLERAIRALVERCRVLHAERARLEGELAERDERIEALEAQVREQNQKRSDVAKRIDELISQLEHLDSRAGARGA